MGNKLYSFAVCSDIHSYSSTTAHSPLIAYKSAKAQGIPTFCCGDFPTGNSGISSQPSNPVMNNSRALLTAFAGLDGLVCAGNHDSTNNYGLSGSDYSLGIAAYNQIAGLSGYDYVEGGTAKNDPFMNVKVVGTDIFIAISDNNGYSGGAGYSSETMTNVKRLIEQNSEKRIFLFTHYPFCYTPTGGTEFTDSFAARICLDSTGNFKQVVNYPAPSDFFKALAKYSNLIWFSGHTHVNWRQQSETLHYHDSKGDYTAEPCHNIKQYQYTYTEGGETKNGAFLVNVPSMMATSQDAFVEVYSDKVVVSGREMSNGQFLTLGNPYVYTWNKSRGGVTTYTATFKADGRVVDIVEFDAGESVLPRVPDVPEKTGYTGVWESYTLTDADIIINAIYTANTYHVTFKADEVVVAVVPYQYGAQSIAEPPVPAKEGYVGTWSAYTLGAQDSVSTAIYTPIQPTIHLYNYDGNVILDVYNFNYQQIYSAYNWEGDEING